MQVIIDHNFFLNEQNNDCLDEIFDFFKSKRHIWLHIDLEVIMESQWYKGLGERDKRYLEQLFVGSTRPSKKSKTISVKQNSTNDFSVREAHLYLNQPLTIVVENYQYESDFINCIFKNYDNELLEAKNNHWLKFENGAGKNDNAIKGMLKELFNKHVFTKDKNNYLRCYSIKDSDRKYCIDPKELPEGSDPFLKDNNIPHHILYKRAKENYMPNVILESFQDEYFKVILKVFKNDLKRDFFNFTNGFDNKNKSDKDWNSKRNDEYVFFEINKIDDSEFKILKNGVDKKEEFKRRFSENFKRVIKEDLEKRIQHQPKLKSKVNPTDITERNEFEHIVHEIKYLL